MKRKICFWVLMTGVLMLQAQEVRTLSLNDAVKMAIERNINVVQTRMDNEKSGYKVSETRASLLPQINGSASYQDNLKMSKFMLPGDMMGAPGTYIPVTMGVEYNANVGVALNQVLFNQTAFVGLQLAKKGKELSGLSVAKAEESIAKEITNLYFLTQTTAQQIQIIKENIERNEKMAGITKVIVDNGFGKQVDYDRIMVSIENQYTQQSNTEALYQQQLNMIKYMLDLDIETEIALVDETSYELVGDDPLLFSDFSNNTDLQLLNKQQDVAKLNKKMATSGYLPSLMFTGQWGINGMRNEFKDFFHGGAANKWFTSYSIGLTLNIPIFDGFEKRSKSRQAKIDVDKFIQTYNDTHNKIRVNYQNATNDYFNNKKNVERQLKNIKLAEKTYSETSLKYKEGMATMSDLLQDQAGLSSAQNNYLGALYNLKAAELELMSLNGEIRSLYN
jgi:outer membrane protein TolC